MIKCISHKKVYPSKEIAEEALVEAHTHYNYAPKGGPVAVYQCDDCGYFHLTSQGTMNPRLALYISNGKLGREKEANRWLDKMKRK